MHMKKAVLESLFNKVNKGLTPQVNDFEEINRKKNSPNFLRFTDKFSHFSRFWCIFVNQILLKLEFSVWLY